MTVYQDISVPLWGGALRAFVAEGTFDAALRRLREDDPAWHSVSVVWHGSYEFDEGKYHCRPRTRPFICTFGKPDAVEGKLSQEAGV